MTYLAAWDVDRAKLFGHCEKKSGIAPTDRLIAKVMRREPYNPRSASFAILQRKVLTPNDFSSLSHVEPCLMDFQKAL